MGNILRISQVDSISDGHYCSLGKQQLICGLPSFCKSIEKLVKVTEFVNVCTMHTHTWQTFQQQQVAATCKCTTDAAFSEEEQKNITLTSGSQLIY